MSNLNRTSKHLPGIALLSCTLVLLLVLSSCGVAERATTSLPTVVVPTAVITATPEITTAHLSGISGNEKPTVVPPQQLTPIATATLSGDTASTVWQSYRSDEAGYMMEYPRNWTVAEEPGTIGTAHSIVTTFGPSGGGPLVIVTMLMQAPDQGELLDIPNTRC